MSAPPAAPMLTDVYRQPAVLKTLAGRADEICRFAADRLGRRRLVVFGSGDGWFAARVAAGLHDTVTAATGLEIAAQLGPRLDDDTAAVAVSMSGNVDRTVQAAGAARRAAGAAVSLTNSDGGRLSELGLDNFSLAIADVAPFLCGTTSFTATAAVLHLWASAGSGASASALADELIRTADALESFLPDADAAARVWSGRAGTAPGVRFLSCGTSGCALADYGAAKFVELTGTRVWSDDIEEFAHRQFWTMERSEVVIMLPTCGFVADIAEQSAAALEAMDVETLMVAERSLAPAGRRAVTWGDVQGDFSFVFQAAALQLIAYHWAAATGYDPNRRRHLKEDTVRFQTSRRLTRRSLLAQAGDPSTAV